MDYLPFRVKWHEKSVYGYLAHTNLLCSFEAQNLIRIVGIFLLNVVIFIENMGNLRENRMEIYNFFVLFTISTIASTKKYA